MGEGRAEEPRVLPTMAAQCAAGFGGLVRESCGVIMDSGGGGGIFKRPHPAQTLKSGAFG